MSSSVRRRKRTRDTWVRWRTLPRGLTTTTLLSTRCERPDSSFRMRRASSSSVGLPRMRPPTATVVSAASSGAAGQLRPVAAAPLGSLPGAGRVAGEAPVAGVADGLSEAAVLFEVAPAAVAVAGAVVAAISATGDPAIWARKSWRCSS